MYNCKKNMKKIGLLFIMTFGFFLLGQLLWTIGLLIEDPIFGSKSAEDWSINILFTLCSIFGMVAAVNLYKYE